MQPIIATYQNGVFAPEKPVEFPEGARVNLWIVPESCGYRDGIWCVMADMRRLPRITGSHCNCTTLSGV
jgi:hypothetical protein